MTSSAQIAANRQNATHSTGPKTEAGKLAVSQNAVRHGCTAAHVVLAHESVIEFECILLQYQREYQPANTHELFLVETIAQARWRIARLRRLETAALDLILGAADPEAPDTILAQSLIGKDGDPLAKIERYTASAERTYHKAQRELADARKTRQKAKTEQSQTAPPPAQNAPDEAKPISIPINQEEDEEYMAFLERATAPAIASGPATAAAN